MAIDYIIEYDCPPKQTFGAQSILDRLKGKARAESIILMFRQSGDNRPPSEMGFEFMRSTPEGEQERRVMVVQGLLDAAEELKPVEHHCAGCPANRTGKPFGCIGFIQYPITAAGETWLMDRLPVPDDTLVWMLLRQGVKEFAYDGTSVEPLRATSNTYFQEQAVLSRRLGEFDINSNQVFEMIFAVGDIQPNHAAMLLLFFHAIRRDLDADEIMNIAKPEMYERLPLILEQPGRNDDHTVAELKEFLQALHIAWGLRVALHVDA